MLNFCDAYWVVCQIKRIFATQNIHQTMLNIAKKYVLDEHMQKIAVQLDVSTYERMEQLLEDYALAQYMKQNQEDELLTLNEARVVYQKMKKK